MLLNKTANKLMDSSKGGQWLVYSLYLFVACYAILPTSKAVNNIFYVFLLAPAVFIFSVKIYQCLVRTKDYFIPIIMAMFLFFAISCFWGDGLNFRYLKYVFYVATFFLLINFLIIEEKLKPEFFIKFCVWVTFLYLAYAFIDTYYIQNKVFPAARIIPLPSRVDNPIYASIWITSVFFCYLGYGVLGKASGLRFHHLFLLALLVFFLYLMRSRSGFVVLFCGAGLVGFIALMTRKSKKMLLQYSAVVFSILLFFIAGYSLGLFDSMIARADSFRFQVWLYALQEYAECGYLLGCGYGYDIASVVGNNAPVAHPHNIFIAHLLYSGIVGCGALMIVTIVGVCRAYKIKSPWGIYLLLACVGLLFDGDKVLTSPSEVWILYILPLAIIFGEYNKAKLKEYKTESK